MHPLFERIINLLTSYRVNLRQHFLGINVILKSSVKNPMKLPVSTQGEANSVELQDVTRNRWSRPLFEAATTGPAIKQNNSNNSSILETKEPPGKSQILEQSVSDEDDATLSMSRPGPKSEAELEGQESASLLTQTEEAKKERNKEKWLNLTKLLDFIAHLVFPMAFFAFFISNFSKVNAT